MLTLAQAIAALVKATGLKPSDRRQFRLANGRITTTNGTVSAAAAFAADFPDTPLVVDADHLKRVWTDTAKAKIDGNMLVVRDRKSTYKLRIVDDLMMMPKLDEDGEQLTAAGRDAILLAAKFAAPASTQPWTCGVAIHNRRAVATNRVAAISAECDLDTDLILPAWAVAALRADGEPPKISASRNGVVLSYPDGLVVHSAPLAEAPPERLFTLVPDDPIDMVSLQPLLDVRADALRLQGKSARLDPVAGTVTTTLEDDSVAVTEIDLGGAGKSIIVNDAVFRLLVGHATHVSFERAPDRLRFRVDVDGRTIAHGVIAGMTQ